MPQTKKKLILWQLPMQRVLYALAPLAIASVYLFGWRGLLVILTANVAGFATEWLFLKNEKQPVSSAVFVTNSILALSIPVTLPLWMVALGAVFAVTFGKMVFGGFGRNIFNPAMVGRAFLYVSFGRHMTNMWVEPYSGFPAGFAHLWRGNTPDALTGATPLKILAEGGNVPLMDLILGAIPGSLGETSAVLIILGGLFIIWKKAANYRIVVGGLVGMLITQALLWHFKVPNAITPWEALFAGGFLFGVFFVATDPVSAATTDPGRWIFGAFVGIMTVLIRVYSSWAEGLMFAVLLGNMFNPIMDHVIKEQQKKKKAEAGS
ncbi:MAG: RnfABCDGE type electron transport complex subunit D [Vulcanimicrobiota bacterium]